VFFRQHVYRPNDVYLLVGDEVVATKAGTHTHGLDRLFASLYGKPVPGLAFFTLSLVSTQQRRSFPIRVEQVVRSDAEKAASKAKATRRKQTPSTAKRRPGRPKGSKNKPKADVTLTPELLRITGMLGALRQLIAGGVPLTSLLLDGHFGNHNALHMARQHNLHLISKLRCDVALYFPYAGPYGGRGPRRKYGRKVDYTNMPREVSQRGYRGRAYTDPFVPGATVTQGVHTTVECRPHRQDQPAYAGPGPCCLVQQ